METDISSYVDELQSMVKLQESHKWTNHIILEVASLHQRSTYPFISDSGIDAYWKFQTDQLRCDTVKRLVEFAE